MGRGRLVTAPDGARWLVRRRWFDRPLPNLPERFRHRRGQVIDGATELPIGMLDFSDGWAAVGALVFGLLIVFVLLPLLGVALEVIALIFVLFSGVVGRVVFGRPWTVEAITEDGHRSVRFAVKGWRRAGDAVAGLEREIATTGEPERLRTRGR